MTAVDLDTDRDGRRSQVGLHGRRDRSRAARAVSANVVTVVKQQEKVIDNSPDAKFFSHLNVKSKAQAEADVPKVQAFASTVRHAASVIADAAADGARQKQGQKDVVAAFRGIANALSSSATALKDSGNGNGAAGEAESNKASR